MNRSPSDNPSVTREGLSSPSTSRSLVQQFIAFNGGPEFKFNEAVSFSIDCEDQAEVDRYWDALIAGGGSPSVCGWLKDRFGVSWQVVPKVLPESAQRFRSGGRGARAWRRC